jgi:hypothetical protein
LNDPTNTKASASPASVSATTLATDICEKRFPIRRHATPSCVWASAMTK